MPASFTTLFQHRAWDGSYAQHVANNHYARVIDDGGTIDSYSALLDAINGLFNAYNTNNLPAFLAAAIDPSIFGYKIGTGSGTTLGRAAQKLYSLIGASSDVVQNTVAAQPLLLRWNSTVGNYLSRLLQGTGQGDYVSTPDSASNQFTTDFWVESKINLFNLSQATADKTVFAKWNTTATPAQSNYYFGFTANVARPKRGVISLSDGITATLYESTADFPINDNQVFWVRYEVDTTNLEVRFYYKLNQSDAFTQVGSAVPIAYGVLNNFSRNVNCCQFADGAYASKFSGIMYYCQAGPLSGSATIDFEPDDYNASLSQNTLESQTTSETWTINRSTATTGYKAQLVYRTTTQGDGIDDRLTTGVLTTTIPQPTTKYFFEQQLSWTSNDYLASFTAMSIFQTGVSPNIQCFTGGGSIDFNGEVLNRLQGLTNVQNGASSLTQVNNGAETTGTHGGVDIAQINLLSDGAARFGNFVLNTLILTKTADNASTRTAVYTLSRGWNGNPA